MGVNTALGWGAGDAGSVMDTMMCRNAAGVVEINNATVGQYRDLKLRSIIYAAPAADGSASGPTTSDYNAGTSLNVGDLVWLDLGGVWQLMHAGGIYDGMPGIALEARNNGQPVNVALPGSTVWAAAKFPTLTVGLPVYIAESYGLLTQTKPTTPDAGVRVMGWAVHP